jgi:ketosteroid isomerase-like protein
MEAIANDVIFMVSMTPPHGAPVPRSGYTLTILRKQPDGRWRLARDANLVTASQ